MRFRHRRARDADASERDAGREMDRFDARNFRRKRGRPGSRGQRPDHRATVQRLPPILVNSVERSSANSAKPTAIVATITPAIRPYSNAVTARRSAFKDNQLVMYSIILLLLCRSS